MSPQRFRIDLGYDGTRFHGWARQPQLRTVQSELERALEIIVGTHVRTVVAGRTDAGVHARRQVVHLDLADDQLVRLSGRPRRGQPARPAHEGLASRLRGVLSHQDASDIVIHAVRPVHADFDARFSALWRSYTYFLADAQTFRDPLSTGFTGVHRGSLDIGAMEDAARSMLGLHDFLAFCKPRPDSTTIRTLEDAQVCRTDDGLIEIRLRADAFCHHMVRATVGGLIKVGSGTWPRDEPARLLAEAPADSPMFVAPAHGLVLEEIGYPPAGQWAARNRQTRALREGTD